MATPRVCIRKGCGIFGCVYEGIEFECTWIDPDTKEVCICGDYGENRDCGVEITDEKEVTGGACEKCFSEAVVVSVIKRLTGGR